MRTSKLLFVLILSFALLFGLILMRQAPAATAQQSGNLIQNPGFEGNFQAWSGIPEIQVAAGWTPWWLDDPDHNPRYFRPEYKRADAGQFPYRVFSGGSSQQYFTFYASHLAGMYQQVPNVNPGQRYRFSIMAQVWSSLEDDPRNSVSPANPHLQIGIDPTGNWSAGSGNVVWSGDASMGGIIDQWASMSVEATAANSVITVFMRTNPDFASKHNDVYWDNASLTAVEPPPPTDPPATNTPDPAAPTLTPSDTPPPTATPVPATPSETPSPTESPTPADTATHTVTPPPTLTDTPLPPTETPPPSPSATAEPSATPDGAEVALASTPPPAEEEGDAAGAGLGSDVLLGVLLLVVGILIGLLLAFIFVLLRRSPGDSQD
jgi:hypothetical protein